MRQIRNPVHRKMVEDRNHKPQVIPSKTKVTKGDRRRAKVALKKSYRRDV